MTGHSGIVTGDSGRKPKIGHLPAESAVTFGRNGRSRSSGISGHDGPEYARKDLAAFDWTYNPKLPRREILELATLKFIEAREGSLLIGQPGTGKSHCAKAIAQLAVQRGYRVFYREAHVLLQEIHEAREFGELRKYRAQINAAELMVIDDLFLRKLPANAGDELADLLMSRYEKSSLIITSNRSVDDWGKLLGDVVVAAPLLDRIIHHGHLLKFEGKSWRMKEAAERLAKRAATA